MTIYKQPQIYYLTLEKLRDAIYMKNLSLDMQNSYYWSDDWSEEFYIELAKAGFISTTYDTKGGLVLLPELQYDYALLDFKDLHISKKVKKLLKSDSYEFSIDTRFDEVIEKISTQHRYNWLKGEYITLLQKLHRRDDREFRVISVELVCKESAEVIAGEVGYIIKNTYTSLSGFSSRDKKHKNCGTLQLVLLSKYLQKHGFAFWNLGHPHMSYKIRLGCKIYPRMDFLQRYSSVVKH